MFTCSRVETENFFYKPKRSPSNKSNLSSNCNNNFNNFTMVPENDQQRVKYHEASLKRNQLKQELQRRHQLCAEKERLCRERAEKQTALKKAEECNALRKFYELKSAQLKRSNSLPTSSNSSLSTNSSLSSTFSSSSKKSFPSRSMSTTIKQFQSAYKIHSFIKHYIEKRNTQRIISYLIKLRSIQNQVIFLKSIKLKGNLTFDLNNKNQVLPISCNNKAFLIYKESLLKILNQLNEFTDELYLVRERKQLIINTVNNMLKELDNVKDLQYKKFIQDIENNKVDEDFVIINNK